MRALFYTCAEPVLWAWRRLTRTHLCRHCGQALEGYDELEVGHCYGWGGRCADIEAGRFTLDSEPPESEGLVCGNCGAPTGDWGIPDKGDRCDDCIYSEAG